MKNLKTGLNLLKLNQVSKMNEMTIRTMRKIKKNNRMKEEAKTMITEEVAKMIRMKQEARIRNEGGEGQDAGHDPEHTLYMTPAPAQHDLRNNLFTIFFGGGLHQLDGKPRA